MNKLSLTLASLALAVPAALAQTPSTTPQGAPPPPPMHGPRHDDMRGPGSDMHHHEDMRHDEGRHEDGDLHGSFGHLLPPGTWWRNDNLAKEIGLTPDQQKRMDDTLLQSRMKLIDVHAAFEKEELLLSPMLNATPFDLAKTQAQVAKIADLRAQLEKTDAGILLGIRSILTPDQWQKLQARRDAHFSHSDRGPQGPDRNNAPHPPTGR